MGDDGRVTRPAQSLPWPRIDIHAASQVLNDREIRPSLARLLERFAQGR